MKVATLSTCFLSNEGLRKILSGESDINLIDNITSLDSFIDLQLKPDIILMCPTTLCNISVDILKNFNKDFPEVKFIIYNTDSKEEEAMIGLVRFGIRGIVYTGDNPSNFINVIRKVHKGEIWVKRESLSKLFIDRHPNPHFNIIQGLLTKRQTEILRLLAEGCKNEIIAEKLFISEHTVKFHLQKIFKNLNCKSRLEAALIYSQNYNHKVCSENRILHPHLNPPPQGERIF